jgi:hypothetical protein
VELNVAANEVLVIGIWALLLLVPLSAFVDGLRFPDPVWESADRHKVAWLSALAVFGLFCGLIGVGIGMVYWFAVAPQLRHRGRP